MNTLRKGVDTMKSMKRLYRCNRKRCADDTGNCGRSCYSESVKVVYKDDDGCAVLSRRWGTTDSSDPKPWSSVPDLIWIELHRTEEVGA